MIDQITVFLENREGRLSALCRTLGDAGVNMSALTIAETSDYGLVRIICDDAAKAKETLDAAGFSNTCTKLIAVAVPNRPNGLAELLELLDELDGNIEYGYCFTAQGDNAVDVFKIGDPESVVETLERAGFTVLENEDLF